METLRTSDTIETIKSMTGRCKAQFIFVVFHVGKMMLTAMMEELEE